jgi:large repetitive protein
MSILGGFSNGPVRSRRKMFVAAVASLATLLTPVGLGVIAADSAVADTISSTMGDTAAGTPNISVTSCSSQQTFQGTVNLHYDTAGNAGHWATTDPGTVVTVSTTPVNSGASSLVGGSSTTTLSKDWGANGQGVHTNVLGNVSVTVPAGTPNGTYSVNVLASGAKAGSGTYTATSSYSVIVSCNIAKPVVSVTGVSNGATYDYNSVPAAGCLVGGTSTPGALTLSAILGLRAAQGLGSQTATCSATNGGGTTTVLATYAIADQTPPVVTVPANLTVEAAGAPGANVSFTVSANDFKDGARSTTCTPASGSTFPIATTPVSCSATDTSGNTGTSSFTVKVSDSQGPVLTLPGDLTPEASSAASGTATWTASASDIVDGSRAVTCIPASGSTFTLDTPTTVSCSSSDNAGNTSTGSFKVTVGDTTAPIITVSGAPTSALEATSQYGATVTYAASASDAVDGTDAVTCSNSSGSLFALGSTTVTCNAMDSHGNKAATYTFAVLVQDKTAPLIDATTVHNIIGVEATGPNGANVSFTLPRATDAVDQSVTVTCDRASGSSFALGTTRVICTATDASANYSQTTFDVSVQDTTAPSLVVPSGGTGEATGASGAVVTFTPPSATDLVDGVVVPVCSAKSGDTFRLGATEVSCTATDHHGNSVTRSFPITVTDITKPVVTPPTSFSVEATSATGATVSFPPASATDTVDGTLSAPCVPVSGSTFALGTTTVTCSATDGHGNIGEASFAVTITDTTGPALGLPADRTVEATSAAGATVTYSSTASDKVDGPVTPTCSPASGATFPFGATPVACTAADKAGNSTPGAFNITVEDTTPPVITVPIVTATEATGHSGAIVTFVAPTAHDVVDGSIAPSCDAASGDMFKVGDNTVTCQASDKHSNSSEKAFVVTVKDTTKPTLHLPAAMTREATGPAGSTADYTATATDIVDFDVSVSCTRASGSTFELGDNKVNCSATDSAGNTADGSFTVTVVDTKGPAVTVPGNATLEATGPDGAPLAFGASAVDLVDGQSATTCAPDSASTFALGTTTVTCSATDTHGNKGSDTFTVLVRDTTAPTLSDVTNLTGEATSGTGATVRYDVPTATDIVDNTDNVTCVPASGTTFELGTTTVTCSTQDAAGNKASKKFDIKIQDTTAPLLSLPGNQVAEATEHGGAPVSWTASASDLVDGSVTPVCAPASGSLFSIATTTVGCSATDAHTNTATGGFTVTVQDKTPPVLSQPADITVEATGFAGAAVVIGIPTATDIVDGDDPVSCTAKTDDVLTVGTHTVTCSSTDRNGNSASVHFTVYVVDTTPPLVTVPGDIAAEATGPDGAPVTFAGTAFDKVDRVVATTCTPSTGASFGLGDTTVTCLATDAHHNTGSATFVVTVVDTTAPELTVPTDITEEATGPNGAKVTWTTTAHDTVSGDVTPSCTHISGAVYPLGAINVSCTATDAKSNATTRTFKVVVQDTTPPIVHTPAVAHVEATGPNGAVVTFDAPTAEDLVDGAITPTCPKKSGDTFKLGTTEVECSATDAAGNKGVSSFAVTITDTTNPVVIVPGDITAEAEGRTGSVVGFTATASDLVDGDLTPTCTPASGSVFAIKATSVGCSATDKSNNTGSGAFTVTVQDKTAPAITVPGDITIEATKQSGAVVTFAPPTALDVVDGSVPATCSAIGGATFPVGATTVTCTAKDDAGNPSTKTFQVTVTDTTAPELTLPPDRIVEASGSTGALVSYAATSIDLVDGSVTPSCDVASGATFGLGTKKVNCSATDAHGNISTGSFSITVVDTTAPVLHLPTDITVSANAISGSAVSFLATANDLVDGAVTPTCSPTSGSIFALGATTVSCTAKDAHNNASTGTFKVTVGLKGSPFTQPLNDPAGTTPSTFKQGSTIPAKFALYQANGSTLLSDGDAQKLADSGLVRFTYSLTPGAASSSNEAVYTDTASSGSAFRYDGSGHQFIYNFSTKLLAAGKNYNLTYEVYAADGKTLIATHTVMASSR